MKNYKKCLIVFAVALISIAAIALAFCTCVSNVVIVEFESHPSSNSWTMSFLDGDDEKKAFSSVYYHNDYPSTYFLVPLGTFKELTLSPNEHCTNFSIKSIKNTYLIRKLHWPIAETVYSGTKLQSIVTPSDEFKVDWDDNQGLRCFAGNQLAKTTGGCWAAGEIVKGKALTQNFKCEERNLKRIDIQLAKYNRQNSCSLKVTLEETATRDIVVEKEFLSKDIVHDNHFYEISFPPQKGSLGKEYTLIIESPDAAPGNAYTVWLTPIKNKTLASLSFGKVDLPGKCIVHRRYGSILFDSPALTLSIDSNTSMTTLGKWTLWGIVIVFSGTLLSLWFILSMSNLNLLVNKFRMVFLTEKRMAMVLYGIFFIVIAYLLIGSARDMTITVPELLQKSAGGTWPAGNITSSTKIVQNFVCEDDSWETLCVQFANYGRKISSSINVTVTDGKSGDLIFKKHFEPDELSINNSFYSIRVPRQRNAKGRTYQFTIESPDGTSGNAFTVWLAKKKGDRETLFINGKKQPGRCIVYQLFDSRYSYVNIISITLIILLFLAVVLSRICFVKNKSFIRSIHFLSGFRYETYFVSIAIMFGSFFCFLTPPFQSPDEATHFDSCNYLSDLDFSPKYMHRKKEVSNSYKKFKKLIFHPEVKTSFKSVFEETQRPILKKSKRVKSAPPAFATSYIPPSFGMLTAKFFTRNPVILLWSGRFFNVIFYVLIGFFTIKISPIAKPLFFLLLLLPMAIFMSATLSYDPATLCLTLLGIALMLKLKFQNEPISNKWLLFLFLLLLVLALCKPPYFFIVFLFLFIPIKNFGSIKRYVSCMALCFLLVFIGFKFREINAFIVSLFSTPASVDSTVNQISKGSKQISFILNNPLKYIQIYLETWRISYSFYMKSFIGIFGWLDTKLPIYIYNLQIALLLIVSFFCVNKKKRLNPYERLLGFGIFLGIVAIVFTGMYVGWSSRLGIGLPFIDGVQGRYFLPVAVLIFFPIIGLGSHGKRKPSTTLIIKLTVISSSVILLIITTLTLYSRYYFAL